MEEAFMENKIPLAVYAYEEGSVEILKGNELFYSYFEYDDKTKLTDRRQNKYISANDQRSIKMTMARAAVSRDWAECAYMRLSKSGKQSWFHMRAHYIGEINDSQVLLTLFTDITVQKNIERKILTYQNQNLKSLKRGGKILIVDDSEASRVILEEIFKDSFQVLTACNGQEAFKLLKGHEDEVEVILLDIFMPVMDGRDFLEKKNSMESTRNIPVVVISADNTMELQLRMLELGVNDYVTKPFVPEIVERRVANVIDYSRRSMQFASKEKN